MCLRKEILLNTTYEIIASLIYYKSPFNFHVRQYNPNFNSYMDQIKSTLNSRHILSKCELLKNMYIIYQSQSDCIYRAQIIDMDSEIKSLSVFFISFKHLFCI